MCISISLKNNFLIENKLVIKFLTKIKLKIFFELR